MTYMTDRSSRRAVSVLGGLSGSVGVTLLGVSFALVVGPPSSASPAELIRFGQEHRSAILIGAWLQAVAPVLIAVFAFVLVYLSRSAANLCGWMTFLGMSILIAISLMEVTFYVCALSTDLPVMAAISVKIIDAIQHLYFVVGAPAVFLPLGWMLLQSRILPGAFAYTAIGLGMVFLALGAAYMLTMALPVAVTAVGAIQSLWWLSAAIFLGVRGENGIKMRFL
jgi:hypothetical protein